MRISLSASDLKEHLLKTLKKGECLVMPCDTIYGLLGRCPDTERKLSDLKGRDSGKPFLQLISHPNQVKLYADQEVPPRLVHHWPGPLTLIMRKRRGGTVALRVPDDILLRTLIAELGASLYSTSANRSGESPLENPREIEKAFAGTGLLIVDGGPLKGCLPSTIIDLTKDPFEIVRQGSLTVTSEDLVP